MFHLPFLHLPCLRGPHLLAVHLLLASTGPALAQSEGGIRPRPRVQAVRLHRAPLLDGRIDDAVWAAVPASAAFSQKLPRERERAPEATSLRVAYDDEALYVAIQCEQRTAPVMQRLTRRDRPVESDWVSVSIDTRRDGRSAFEFMVNAAGVLTDLVRYDDTELSLDWDENWEARTAIDAEGWSAEMRIPLRILRFASLPVQSWGLQSRRYVSHRQELDEWALIPRSVGGEVSQYGRLEDLRGLRPGRSLEISPFVWTRVRQDAQLAAGRDFGAAAGLDLKWHPSQRLTLDAAVLPDFAQVEADQVVLNLTTFETNYPEKRRLFLEGIDAFATSEVQLLYTRRIGRPPSALVLREGERLLGLPEPAAIYGAAKLTGQIADGWEVGVLTALTAPNRVEVAGPDGSHERRIVDPLSAYNVARVRRAFGNTGQVGLTATSVVRGEPTVVPGEAPLCPDGRAPAASGRCSNNAQVASLDWRWRSPSGDYVTVGQLSASLLQGGPPRPVPDGTVIQPGDVGTSTRLVLAKEGGRHWVGNVWGAIDRPKFDVNDVGYLDRANQAGVGGAIGYRTLEPWAATLETKTKLSWLMLYNNDRLPVSRLLNLDSRVWLTSFWLLSAGVGWVPTRFEDREVGDGTALERPGFAIASARVETDPRSRVSGHLGGSLAVRSGAHEVQAEAGVLLQLLPQLDLELIPQLLRQRGEVRYAATTEAGDHLFGPLQAHSANATVRATYTFTPRLTLQTYAQLFLASTHFGDLAAFTPVPGARSAVRLRDLRPVAVSPPQNPDRTEGALNANLVLRWEFRTGWLLYLVYTRAQVPALQLAPGEMGRLDFGSVRRAPASDVLLLKVGAWWG